MKKQYLYIPLNIILILAILGGIGYAMWNTIHRTPVKTEKTIETAPATVSQAAPATSQEAVYDDRTYRVGIIQHTDNDGCNACYQGFIAKLAQRGYVNSNNLEVDYVIEQDEKKCIEAMKKMVEDKPDIIYSIGIFTTGELSKMTKDIPIVFSAVPDPESEGFVESNEHPGSNITGVSSFIPTFEQIDSIKFLVPEAKKLGAIYDATNETSVLQALIAKSEAETEALGLKFEKYPIIESTDITSQLNAIKEDGDVDVLFLPVDSVIGQDIGEIIDFAKENKLPTICGNEAMLEEGGFSTTLINYTSIGGKAADLAVDIMVNGKDPATTPVVYKYECDTVVNSAAMKDLGISLSAEAKENCEIKEY